MNLNEVKGSSNIAKVRYSEIDLKLKIKFVNGGEYDYTPVSLELYEQFMAAESKGKFFLSNIRNNKEILANKVVLNEKDQNSAK